MYIYIYAYLYTSGTHTKCRYKCIHLRGHRARVRDQEGLQAPGSHILLQFQSIFVTMDQPQRPSKNDIAQRQDRQIETTLALADQHNRLPLVNCDVADDGKEPSRPGPTELVNIAEASLPVDTARGQPPDAELNAKLLRVGRGLARLVPRLWPGHRRDCIRFAPKCFWCQLHLAGQQ